MRTSSYVIYIDLPENAEEMLLVHWSGSWEKIRRNVTLALEKDVAISIRLNVDRNNLDQMPKVAEAIQAEGWESHPKFSAYTAPIHGQNENVERRTTMNTYELDQALADMRKQFPRVSLLGRPDDSIRNHAQNLFHASNTEMPPALRESYCSAHVGMYIFDAFADIYACWERTGDPNIRLGHITEDGELQINSDFEKLWRSRTVASNPVCRKCRYNMHCGGGCAVLAEGDTGRYHANYCDAFASRFRSSVAESYLASTSGEEFKQQPARVCDQ